MLFKKDPLKTIFWYFNKKFEFMAFLKKDIFKNLSFLNQG